MVAFASNHPLLSPTIAVQISSADQYSRLKKKEYMQLNSITQKISENHIFEMIKWSIERQQNEKIRA